MTLAETLKKKRSQSGKSRYEMAQYGEIDEAYLKRLEDGEKTNPSRYYMLRIIVAIVAEKGALSIYELEELLNAAGFTGLFPVRKEDEKRLTRV